MAHTKRSTRNRPATTPGNGARPDARSQLAAIVEHSNDAIFARDMTGVVTTWNAAATRMFGFRAKEILGQSSRRLLPAGQRDEFRSLLRRLQRGGAVKHYQTERQRRDGRRLCVSLTLSPIRDHRRRLVGFSTIARDVTEERRVKELLTRHEHELQDLFEAASIGLLIVAREGTILRANHGMLELLDCSARQVVGRSLGEFHLDPAAINRLLAQLARRQTLHNFPTEFLTREGQRRHVLVDANALWERGRFVHSRWFIRDISRRKQLERELLELSERERRGFAQELHDGLGQQLGGVAYLCNVLQEKLAERNAPETTAAARIFKLVREAIEQTRRISRGLSPISPEPEGLLIALRELAAQTTEVYHVRCRFHCAASVRLHDANLAGHMFRIAQEAVNNALKHAQPKQILIRLRQVRDHLTLVVGDDGRGIGPISPRRAGLGLHIMQYRADLVRGTLTVQRRPRGGTEVHFRAPANQQAPDSKRR